MTERFSLHLLLLFQKPEAPENFINQRGGRHVACDVIPVRPKALTSLARFRGVGLGFSLVHPCYCLGSALRVPWAQPGAQMQFLC